VALTDPKTGTESPVRQRADPHHRAPRVSVIMATYNGSRFIRQSINSILGQTIQDFELIITEDCSDDGTSIILSRINDPRVKILSNSANLGVVKSRNRCLAAARGQYVAMLDHDDLSRPNRLAKQVAYLEEHPGIMLVGTAAHTLDNGH
jgi:glycosyltransferase involved in cell wall biosynthesis